MAAPDSRWRPVVRWIAILAAIWCAVIAITGGFDVRVAGIRFASRDPMDAAMLALAALAVSTTIDSERPSALGPVSAVAVLGCALVIGQWWSARPLWLDEQMIALNLRDRTMGELTGRLWLEQSAPAGWMVLQRIALVVFGTSESAMRLVAAFFGVATIICAGWIGHRWMTPLGSVIFVLLCSLGQWMSFFAVELKPYSGDMFWGLFLAGITAWTIDALDERVFWRRVLLWTVTSAIAHWVSIGGLLVLPACGLILAIYAIKRYPRESIPRLAAAALVVFVSFLPHYLLVLRHARESQYFRDYWAFAFPPASADVIGIVTWLAHQLHPFALKPGGTNLWWLLWPSAAAGFVLARQRALGALAGLIVLSGFVLAALRIVPLHERLSLWFVPALYLGVALFADNVAFYIRHLIGRRQWIPLTIAIVPGFAIMMLCADIVRVGYEDVRYLRPAHTNRETDDRGGVAWALQRRQPNDAVVTTRLGLPAIWWYGNIPIDRSDGILAADYDSSTPSCDTTTLWNAVKGYDHLLVYLSFEDMPKGFPNLLLEQLSQIGTITAVEHFGTLTRAAIVDLHPGVPAQRYYWRDAHRSIKLSGGCATLRAASGW